MGEIRLSVYIHSGNDQPIIGNHRQYVFGDGKNGFQSCAIQIEDISGDNLPGTVSLLRISKHSAF